MSEDFFGKPPPPSPEDLSLEQPREPWMGAPGNVVGGSVPLDVLLYRSDRVAIAIERVRAYPEGFEFTQVVRFRRPEEDPDMEGLHGLHFPRHRAAMRAGEWPPELLRFGVRFADGSKATNLPHGPGGPSERPSGPVLVHGGGGGGAGRWDHDYWVWPLPPEGRLWFVCEWPSAGVPFTEVKVDTAPIREAAGRAVVLWSEDPGGPGHGMASYFSPLR